MQQLVTAAKNVLLTIVLAFVGWFYLRSGIPELATLPAAQPLGAVQGGRLDCRRHGLDAGGGLHGCHHRCAAAELPVQAPPEDEPPGSQAGTQGIRRQPGSQGQDPPEAARDGAPRLRLRVPKADFVVTNPTHYAVALRYDEATMAAPR
jgi:flagellar biosynthetic protein FlhB